MKPERITVFPNRFWWNQSVSIGLPCIGLSVCTIKTRASRVGRCGVHLTVNIKSIDPHVLNSPTGTGSGEHSSPVSHCLNVCAVSVNPYNSVSTLIAYWLYCFTSPPTMKNLPLVQNWFIKTGPSIVDTSPWKSDTHRYTWIKVIQYAWPDKSR